MVDKYLAALGYNQDMIEWAIAADPKHMRCLNPELAKQFNIEFWYNTEDGQHYILPGDHGMLLTPSAPLTKSRIQHWLRRIRSGVGNEATNVWWRSVTGMDGGRMRCRS